jgi:serine phosphatase RsbU (regulator of sigma subunit)/anti-sigma regulatory factor (Ser/Thr protein kinase)/CHASE1-domain containing sensor protein
VAEPVAPGAPSRFPRPARRALVFVILLLLLIATLLSWLFVRLREDNVAQTQRDEALETASSALQTSLRIAESALRGVPAIVRPDGRVEVAVFQAYGADVLAAKTGTGMAYEAVVAGPDRAAFEAATGLTIQDQRADGQLVPAASRDRYCPIVSLVLGPQGVPGSEGFDICSSPARRAAADAAAATGDVALTAPFTGVPSGRASVSLFRALYPPGTTAGHGQPIGFVSLSTRTDTLLANAGLDAPKGARLRVTDGGALVFGPAAPLDAPSHTVSIGGREWMVQLTENIHASYVGSWMVLASGLVLVALLTLLAARTLRYESQLEQLTAAQERDVQRTAKVARLARVLSGARGFDNVEAVVRREAGRPFEATEVALAVDGDDDGHAGLAADGSSPQGPLLDARQTMRPVLVEDAADLAARYCDPPAGFTTPGLASILAVPLPELTEGTVHGALAFGWTEPQELNLADLDVASTVAELVAGALVRARTMEQVRTKAASEEQRADIATALMDATTVDRVARRTLAGLSRQLEVAWGYVAVGDATREGSAVRATLPDRREHRDWDVPAFDHLQPGATPWLPDAVLGVLSGGEPIGRCEALVISGGPFQVVVVAGWRPGADAQSGLGEVADIITQAILRAGVFDREASTAEALQDALLTTDSHSRDVVFATRYRPAESPMLVGGDWYDLVVDDGRLLVTVGDVVGQGLAAATVMGQLRSALRAALLGSADPISALEVVDRFAESLGPSTFATVAVAALDPQADEVTFCYAGHPPLLHIGRDGAVRPEEGGRSWPIGASWPGPRPRTIGRVDMEPAEAIVLFTDGLFERRHEPLDVGLERVRRATEDHAALPAAILSDALLAASGDGAAQVKDDAVVIVVRRVGSVPGRCFADVFPADGAQLRGARQRFGAWLGTLSLPAERHNDLLLAVNEAMGNAIEHGAGAQPDRVVQVEAGVRGAQLLISVTDPGRWQERESASPDRGRGLLIMRRLVNKVEIGRGPRGTTVTLEIDLALHPISA